MTSKLLCKLLRKYLSIDFKIISESELIENERNTLTRQCCCWCQSLAGISPAVSVFWVSRSMSTCSTSVGWSSFRRIIFLGPRVLEEWNLLTFQEIMWKLMMRKDWAANSCLLAVEVEVVGGCLVCRQRRFYEGLEGEAGSSVPSSKSSIEGRVPLSHGGRLSLANSRPLQVTEARYLWGSPRADPSTSEVVG